MAEVTFYFDFASPNAYMAYQVLPDILARTGATMRVVPCLLGGLFKATGNVAPMVQFAGVPAKLAYERREMERFIAAHGITRFKMNPHFPVNTLLLMRGAVVAELDGALIPYVEAGLAAMWEEGLNMSDPDVFVAAFDKAGLDGKALLVRTQDQAVKDGLAANTEAAVALGAFGIPSFVVGDELFFGKDRLDQVEAALRGDSSLQDRAHMAAREEANKRAVVESYDLALNQRDIESAIKYLSPNYKQHNPTVADGLDGWRAMVTYIKDNRPGFKIDIKRVFADGDFVIMHVHMMREAGERGNAVVEIFRFEDGKIAEHWDVIQPIPENPANPNTMF